MAAVQPSNNSELQLYRVLQRANLLQYFETFITQGGDDVQQLCEAGEDEFLEIMALVGMASKPLHVRRLQKALQEWVANPSAFEERSSSLQDYKVTPSQSSTISTSTPWSSQARDASPSDGSNLDDPSSSNSPPGDFKDNIKDILFQQTEPPYLSMMGMSQPVLLEHQINAIAAAAAMLAQELPPFEPKPMPKKQISRDIAKVMLMSTEDPTRMDAMRRYAAIYGRFDSKRKNHRPMSMHEISVNEAAAQLCSHIPALLSRREELFPLARQVVRDSGYQYSKGHSRYEDQGATEILLQPKQEQGEAVPAATSILTSPVTGEDSFNDLQKELTQITLELTELAKEQNRIRSALRVLLEMNDHDQMKALTAEMDDLNDRQTAMIKRRHRIVNTIAKYRKGGSDFSAAGGTGNKISPKNSPLHGVPLAKPGNKYSSSFYGYSDEPLASSNPLNTLYMAAVQNHKDSLFEEGLRIATQYGMADFAQELIGMKSTKEEGENKKDSGVSLSSGSNSAFSCYSSPVSGEAVTSSSSSLAMSGNGKFMQLMPSSSVSLSPYTDSDIGVIHTSRPLSHSSLPGQIKLVSDKKGYYMHSDKNLAVGLSSFEASCVSNDESTDGSCLEENCAATKSSSKHNIPDENSVAQGSTTTTTTITTKSGQVIEVETRRSSRRKTGEPDYYLINGGEKRFRSGSIRRSSSTSSERTRRLSSSSSASSSLTPAATSPHKSHKLSCILNEDVSHILEAHQNSKAEDYEMTPEMAAAGDESHSIKTDTGVDGVDELQYDSHESDSHIVRRKGKAFSVTGQRLQGQTRDYS
ncbi:unnamed protein product [Candidula unifasciata]|uniref:Uncharacterized protein n=1 Tax=Candidula unifasciata TaxID=100452 RepID=A0A8S3ZCM6_9EUPU|nr:unnamed protein product [Candidula unifasciata]